MPTFRDGRSIPVEIEEEVKRHQEKLEKVIRERLLDLIESIRLIGTSRENPREIITIRIKGVKEFRFRFATPKEGVAGQLSEEGEGESNQKGAIETIAGREPGEKEYDDYQIDRSKLQDMLFERWKLPPPVPKEWGNLAHEKEKKFRGLRRRGPFRYLARRITSKRRLNRIMKQASEDISDELMDEPFVEDDLRYFKFEREEEGTKAVQFCLRDISGSMSGSKQEICRVLFTYICAYRERRFPEFEAKFLVHTTEAEETDEIEFFRRTASGGTKMSSVLKLMLDQISNQYNPEEWNIYGMYASDGENQTEDDPLSAALVEKILGLSRLFVYMETATTPLQAPSPLYHRLEKLAKHHKNLVVTRLLNHTPEEAVKILNIIFEREWEVEADVS
jgi:uncharacterized sporulation protein YeaH/YhbH (DUF444 family)